MKAQTPEARAPRSIRSVLAVGAGFALILGLAACAGPGKSARAENAAGDAAGQSPGKESIVIMKQADAANVCVVVPDEELKKRLTPLQIDVVKNGGTERPFANAYWDNHEAGIYLDVVDGTPLFASQAKYESGTGWPSFYQPLDPKVLALVEDRNYGMVRIEVRAAASGAHLGHLFDDGPEPTGKRYCMNSAALRFVPKDRLEAEGLGRYRSLFE